MVSHLDDTEKLRDLSNKQSCVLLLGLPRGGSTATLRSLAQQLFAAAVNQPAMFSRDCSGLPGFRDRRNAIANRVLGEAAKRPGSVLIKENAHLTLPEDLAWWRTIIKVGIVLVRNPALQLESLIWQSLDRVEAEGLGQHRLDGRSVNKDLPTAELTVDGKPFFARHAGSLPLRSAPPGLTEWEAQMQHLRRTRDYRVLDEGFRRLMLRHPSFEDPEYFCAVAATYCDRLGRSAGAALRRVLTRAGVRTVDRLLARYYGVRWEDFASLPDVLVDAMFAWRLGHFPMELHFSRDELTSPFHVVDFSELQLDSTALFAEIRRVLEQHRVPLRKEPGGPDLVQCPPGTDTGVTRLDLKDWQRFYAYSDFRVSLSGDGEIRKPQKSPIAPRRFPRFFQAGLMCGFRTYVSLLMSPQRLNSRTLCERLREDELRGIDPVTCYALAAVEGLRRGQPSAWKASTAALRQSHARYHTYFAWIDACLTTPLRDRGSYGRTSGTSRLSPPVHLTPGRAR